MRATASPGGRRATFAGGWVLFTVLVALLPTFGLGTFGTRQIVLVTTFSLIVSGLNLSFGFAGELALGQTAVYAAGSYLTAYFATKILNDILLTMLLSLVAALIIGLVTGIPGLRLGGWLLAMTSFFLVLLIPPIVDLLHGPLGGAEGFTGIPVAHLFGQKLGDTSYYVLVVVVTSVWFAVLRNLVTSPHGRAFRVLKTSPVLAESLGVARYSTKLKAYAIGAIPAGIAGTLSAYLDGYISPGSYGLDFAISLLAASILGGSASVYGTFFGAAVIVVLPLQITAFKSYSLVAYGVLLILGGVLFSRGLAGYVNLAAAKLRRRRPPPAAEDLEAAEATTTTRLRGVAGKSLRLTGVGKSFGGNHVLSDVSLHAAPGQVTAIIGPNGSGKTTLMNLVSGFYTADSGEIVLGEQDITSLKPAQVSAAGVGRTFQTPLVPADMTVREVIATGMFAGSTPAMPSAVLRTPSYYRRIREQDEQVDAVLAEVGLKEVENAQAASLALGTRRILELARVLAGDKSVFLLDEVASGLDEEEIAEIARVVRLLRDAGRTVVLVEHNFSLVRQLADEVVVLADGGVIASGPPAEIENSPEVLRRYLGEGAAVTGTRVDLTSPRRQS